MWSVFRQGYLFRVEQFGELVQLARLKAVLNTPINDLIESTETSSESLSDSCVEVENIFVNGNTRTFL